MIYTVTEESGTKGLEQLAGSSSTGTPLGTWASFENDYAPNIEWLQGGTTFNPNTYPALAMYLGGNTVPERYDHDRPSEWETITIPLSSASAITMQYDGILNVNLDGSSDKQVYINGVRVTAYTNASMALTYAVAVKKGDVVYATGHIQNTCYAQYYKHPMFIKATPTSSDTDYQGTLNGIRTYVSNSNSYSTEEVATGGTWIDGKPIYRKGYSGTITNNYILAENVDKIVSQGGWTLGSDNAKYPFPYYYGMQLFAFGGASGVARIYASQTRSNGEIWIEYTKSTD